MLQNNKENLQPKVKPFTGNWPVIYFSPLCHKGSPTGFLLQFNPFSAEPCVVNCLRGWQGVNGIYSCTNCANITSNTWACFPDNTKV